MSIVKRIHVPPHARGCLPAAMLALLLSACAAAPTPSIPVIPLGPDAASALAGDWWGSYGSVESGRHGRVRFSLVADAELEATGDVLMVPQRRVESEGGAERMDQARREHELPVTLRVRFVQVDEGGVLGALEPYADPECGCMVSTTFAGRLDGDTLEGTYVSQGGPMHLGHSGHWRVERRSGADD